MMSPSRWVRAAAVLGAAAVAACGSEATGPSTISNPAATLADMRAVDSAFNTDAFQALSDLVGEVPALAPPAALGDLMAALGATVPSTATARTLAQPDAGAAGAAARVWGALSPTVERAAVIPDTLLGVTFDYDAGAQAYVATQLAGAPANGVRFLLYMADSLTGEPDTNHPVGSLDIIDNAPAVGFGLRFVLRGTGGAPTYLDYTLAFQGSGGDSTVTANGYVSNGRAGALERRFTFGTSITASATAGGGAASVDFHYDVNVPAVAVDLLLTTSDDTLTDTSIAVIDYRFTRHNETIRLAGADTATAGVGATIGGYQVTVNGNLYATVDAGGNITDRAGQPVPIDPNDQRYEDEVVAGLGFGILYSILTLGVVLALPSLLIGFSLSLL